MSVNPWKSILLLRLQRISYNSMSWGCLGMLKNRSGMNVVSNRCNFVPKAIKKKLVLAPHDFAENLYLI